MLHSNIYHLFSVINMGIRGIRMFMERNGILQPYTLKNTRVVIDGNNICHQLLYNGNGRRFGGDYNIIKEDAWKFFNNLLRCNVQPYVVFDGAHDEDDKKLADIKKKCEARIKENEIAMPQYMESIPVLMYESFTMVLKDMNIPHLACEGEADNQIAVLATQWRCPVISCDGDMYIFDLPGGFIHFSDIHTDMHGEIKTQLYLASTFEVKTGLSTTLLPLAATLFGNSYVEMNYNVANFFFQRLGAGSNFSNLSRNLKHAFGILRNVRDKATGLRMLMECVDEKLQRDEAVSVKIKINTSVNFYTAVNNFEKYNIANYFNGQGIVKHHECLPDRVMANIHSCTLSGLPIDITIGRVILKPSLELYDLPPIPQMCRPLRQIVYGIVNKSMSPDTRKDEIIEIIREKRQMTTQRVMPKYDLQGYDSVPSLQEIDMMDNSSKTKLMAVIFQYHPELLIGIPEESQLFQITLNYFIKNGNVPNQILYSKMYVFCHILMLKKETHSGIQAMYGRLCDHSGRSDLDIHLFHEYLQRFQECLNMAYTINALVDTPIRQPDPAIVYDGSLMYSVFYQEKTEGRDVDALVQEGFRGDPGLHRLYEDLVKNMHT